MSQEIISYVKLGIAALLPVFASILMYFLNKKTIFGKWPYWVKQSLYGIVFGALAIVGTEWGIPLAGAQVNCRDAAVLTAGLMFGAPAGIIAGVIGGVERWIAVAWGVGSFTRIACSVSTVIAGVYAALLRKYMFEDRKSTPIISMAIGVVMEVFHLTMVFITNMAEPERAMSVVKACTIPMVTANGLSVMLASFLLMVFRERRESKESREKQQARISQTVQRWLFVTVMLAFVTTSFFVFRLQDALATSQSDSLLDLALNEVSADIQDASDVNMLAVAKKIAAQLRTDDIYTVTKENDVAEISIVNREGKIIASSNPEFLGFDMNSGDQSREFLCLLGSTTEYVQEYGPISQNDKVMRKFAGVKTEDGFIQIGYNADQFHDDIATQVVGITKNRHVGKSGYILILNENNSIISAPKNITKSMIEENAFTTPPSEGATFEMTINGEECYCRYSRTEGYYILSVLPASEALQLRNIALYVNTFLEIMVFAVLFYMIYILIKKVVVNQIKKINNSLAEITDGNLDVVVDVRSNAEFASLSDDINSTVGTLKRYIAEAAARIDKELTVAKNIQSSALPSVFPAFPKRKDFDIFASMNPAKEVGGDFYDFYITHDDTLNFLVADVSGKGIPAAMFMMRAKTELKSLTEADLPLNEVFAHGNDALCEGNDAGMFVTAWEGSVNLDTGLLSYVNAGHNPPLVCHAGGKFEYLKDRPGLVLAGMDGMMYKKHEHQLQTGDTVFLYTDGVTEATNAAIQLFGEERLLETINAKEFSSMQDLCRYVKSEVDAFVDEAPQFDDITMLAFRYFGQKTAPEISFPQAVLDDIPKVTDFVEAELEKLGAPMKTVIQINVAIDELFSNIVRYGYPNGSGPVTVRVIEKEDPHAVAIQFIDEGVPYNPLVKEDPDITLSAEDRNIGGLGIFMVKKTMDDMKYHYENEKNILTIIKNLE